MLNSIKEVFNRLTGDSSWRLKRAMLREIEKDSNHCDEHKVLTLIGKGVVDVNAQDWFFRSTPLIMAADRGHLRIAQALLKGGARPDSKDVFGSTALIYAARRGHAGIVRLLADSGAKLDETDSLGDSALLASVRRGYGAIAEMLIGRGANLEIKGNEGLTVLGYAAKHGYGNIAAALVHAGASLTAIDPYGKTVQQIAIENGHQDIVIIIEKAINERALFVAVPPVSPTTGCQNTSRPQ